MPIYVNAARTELDVDDIRVDAARTPVHQAWVRDGGYVYPCYPIGPTRYTQNGTIAWNYPTSRAMVRLVSGSGGSGGRGAGGGGGGGALAPQGFGSTGGHGGNGSNGSPGGSGGATSLSGAGITTVQTAQGSGGSSGTGGAGGRGGVAPDSQGFGSGYQQHSVAMVVAVAMVPLSTGCSRMVKGGALGHRLVDLNQCQGEMYISLDRTIGAHPVGA